MMYGFVHLWIQDNFEFGAVTNWTYLAINFNLAWMFEGILGQKFRKVKCTICAKQYFVYFQTGLAWIAIHLKCELERSGKFQMDAESNKPDGSVNSGQIW